MTRTTTEIELLEKVKSLEVENQNLRRLLEIHGISLVEGLTEPSPAPIPSIPKQQNYSINAKISIFRNLFRGRTDVYPVRWTSQKSGKSGYSPACANEWRPGVCAKPKVKCAECNNRSLLPVTDETIYNHLIALPLQKEPRARGCSVFVDEQLNPLPDQWS